MRTPPELPNAVADEQAFIGCLLTGGLGTAVEAVEQITPEVFLDDDYREAFGILSAMSISGERIDQETLLDAWRSRYGVDLPLKIVEAPDKTPSAANWPYYATKLLESHERRQAVLRADRIRSMACDPTVTLDALREALEPPSTPATRSAAVVGAVEVVRAFIDDTERRFNLQGELPGIATGFRDLDSLTDGLQPGEQFIVGARPSQGKTALACNVVETACVGAGIPTLFVTLEMAPRAIARRLVASIGRIPMGTLRSGRLTEGDLPQLTAAQGRLAKAPLRFFDGVSGASVTAIVAAIRRDVRAHGTKLVVVDYLQKIPPAERHEKRTYEVGAVSGALKGVAASTGVAMLTLAQLSREPDKDKGRLPRLSDLADSAQVERDADVVALLHRPRTQDDPAGTRAALIVAKQRDGELGTVDLEFDGRLCRFETIDARP